MTLNFITAPGQGSTGKKRYYVSQFDNDTYQIIDAIEDREVCVCTNYDNWDDAKERAKRIAELLNKKA